MVEDNKIIDFYNEICNDMGNNYKIILEPGRDLDEKWIEYDKVKWEIEDIMKDKVYNLKDDPSLTLEEKILKIYEFICLYYVYDVNVLYFFRKDNSDPENVRYIAVDWYGRIVEQDWINNRKKHNRRICYEFSRFFAKAINELIGDNKDKEAVMIGDYDNTHYVVGLIGNDYSVILDQDDFNSIKDLTRLKLGLSLKGIHILKDDKNIFTNLVAKYNLDKPENLNKIDDVKSQFAKKDVIKYISECIEILKKFNLDSQGFFEYMRYLIEEQEIEIEKVWKIDNRPSALERRHERCLYFNYNNKTYLVDSINYDINCIDIDKLDPKEYILKPEENEYQYYGS